MPVDHIQADCLNTLLLCFGLACAFAAIAMPLTLLLVAWRSSTNKSSPRKSEVR